MNFQRAGQILEAQTADLRELAVIAGAKPEDFYAGSRLGKVDIKGQNLTGMRFSSFDFKSLEIDASTRISGYQIEFLTTKGSFIIAMRPDLAPIHTMHIKRLVEENFYDGVVFHRVIDGFMAQTGCPHGTGTGGSRYPNLKQEFNREPHKRGTVSMARAQQPDSANSQFFICFADAGFLDRQYTVWGHVVVGMENVDEIKRGEPVRHPDRIEWAKII